MTRNIVCLAGSALLLLFTAGVSANQDSANQKVDMFVDEFIEANKVWLQPDWSHRAGLVYDYTQEHGHLQHVTFDHYGNCLVVYVSPTVFPDNEASIAAAERHAKPFFFFPAERNIFVSGNENSTFLIPSTPRPTQRFSGQSGRVDLATGWHWLGATKFLGLFPNEFDWDLTEGELTEGEFTENENGETILLTLKPRSRDATLDIGTMLSGFSSFAYLPNRRYERCEVLIDRATNRPIEERYFREGESEPFSTIRYFDWIDLAGGQAPGRIEAEQSMGEDRSFSVVATFRDDEGRWLAERIVSTFHRTDEPDSGSTGVITIVRDEAEIARRLQTVVDVLQKIDDTQTFLDAVANYPIERVERLPFQLNTPTAAGFVCRSSGRDEAEPWRNRMGITQWVASESEGSTIIDVDVFSTRFGWGYAVTLRCRLLDENGESLAEIVKDGNIRAYGVPAIQTISFEFGEIDPQNIKSIELDFRIGRRTAWLRSLWMTVGPPQPSRGIRLFSNLRDWGPEQAIGEPDSSMGRDSTTAWSPRKQNDGIQWLELLYPRMITAVGVTVFESYNPGALIRVTTFDAHGNESLAWDIDSPEQVNRSGGAVAIRFTQPVDTRRIRLYLDTDKVDGWNAINAVGLWSEDRQRYWAIDAEASSTYATEPRPDSFLFVYDGPLTEIKYDQGYHEETRSLVGIMPVIEMQRPQDVPYLNAVKALVHSSLRPRLGQGEAKVLILDTDMNILHEMTARLPDSQIGAHWYTVRIPSVEVPETFRVAFQFTSSQDDHRVIFGTRVRGENESCRSFVQEIDSGELMPLKHGTHDADWVIRAYLSAVAD